VSSLMAEYQGLILFLGTGDLEAVSKFYSGVLGLPLFLDQGSCRIYAIPGGGMVGFCLHLEVVSGHRAPTVTLVSHDVDRVYRALLAAGLETDGPPRFNPSYGIYHFFTKDPDGYTVEVQRFV